MMLRAAATVAATAAVFCVALGDVDTWPSTETDHTKLQITLPKSLSKNNGYVHKDALFGYPAYTLKSLEIKLIVTNSTACELVEDTSLYEHSFALLVDRGDCHFVDKVRNAQKRGARAVLIADNKCLCSDTDCLKATHDDMCETVLPFMADDESGSDITIPSMLIRKVDSDAIKQANSDNVMVKFDWDIPSPDGRVEWTLWQSSWDEQTAATLSMLESMVQALGSRAQFTPRFVSYNGSKVGCFVNSFNDNNNKPCGNMCLNNGRYCLLDPSPYHDRSIGASGADVVTENLRQKCIWKIMESSDNKNSMRWWRYVQDVARECGQDEAKFKDKNCALTIMKRYNINVDSVEKCMEPYGVDIDAPNAVLDEELKEQNSLQLLRLPALFVDGVHARGRIDAYSVLAMICAAYGSHNAPHVCSCVSINQQSNIATLADCVKAGSVSNAAKAIINDKKMLSPSVVAAILSLVAVVMAITGVVYYRRSKRQMRDQVRSILAEYMPLEDQALLDGDGDDDSMHPAERASAKSPRGYLPTDGFLEDVGEDGV